VVVVAEVVGAECAVERWSCSDTRAACIERASRLVVRSGPFCTRGAGAGEAVVGAGGGAGSAVGAAGTATAAAGDISGERGCAVSATFGTDDDLADDDEINCDDDDDDDVDDDDADDADDDGVAVDAGVTRARLALALLLVSTAFRTASVDVFPIVTEGSSTEVPSGISVPPEALRPLSHLRVMVGPALTGRTFEQPFLQSCSRGPPGQTQCLRHRPGAAPSLALRRLLNPPDAMGWSSKPSGVIAERARPDSSAPVRPCEANGAAR